MKKETRSECPVSRSLEIFGDRWTLLIIRDIAFIGNKKFEDFLTSPEKISTNILADRLKKLEESGIIEKRLYGTHSQRGEYFLTEKGETLIPVLHVIAEWGKKQLKNQENISRKA